MSETTLRELVAERLLAAVAARGGRAWAEGGDLHIAAPRAALRPAEIAALRDHKAEILSLLAAERPVRAPCSANRPYRRCAACGRNAWSSAGRPRWYCGHCGVDAPDAT